MRNLRHIRFLSFAMFAGLFAWVWFAPSGEGEYATSPNGRYMASASSFKCGTWLHGRVDYVEIEIVENSTGKVVWKAERYPMANERPPTFGDRSQRFIHWTADSRSVSIPVGGAADAVMAVP